MAAKAARVGRRDQGRLERLFDPAHGGVARRRARYRLRAGAGRQLGDRDGQGRRARRCVPARRRRDRHRAWRVRRLHRHAWRPRRASRRRDPAGRGLHGKIRPLRQHRRPRADGGARRFPPGDAREDWAILRALSDVLGQKLPYDSLSQLRAALFKAHPHLARVDQITPGDAADIEKLGEPWRHAPTRRRSVRRSPTSI